MNHYDLEQAEKTMRESARLVQEEADRAVARGDAEEDFVLAQRFFDDQKIQFGLTFLRAQNEGHSMLAIACGLGAQLGTFIGSVATGLNDEERSKFFEWLDRAATDTMQGQIDDGFRVDATIDPIQSGSA